MTLTLARRNESGAIVSNIVDPLDLDLRQPSFPLDARSIDHLGRNSGWARQGKPMGMKNLRHSVDIDFELQFTGSDQENGKLILVSRDREIIEFDLSISFCPLDPTCRPKFRLPKTQTLRMNMPHLHTINSAGWGTETVNLKINFFSLYKQTYENR